VQATRALERAIEIQPEAAPYYTELARAMIASGLAGDQPARAGSVLAKAIEIDPSDASARFELAKLEMGRGRLDEAEQHLLKAVDAAPEFFEAYYVLGQVYARAKKTAQSRKSMQMFQEKKSAIEARSAIWKDATVRVGAE
jgi:tetratricopeptide (TPR) repeat protein